MRMKAGISVNSLVEFLKSFGLSRLAAIIGVTAGVAIGLILIMLRIGQPQYSVLYADLDYGNAQSVINQLELDGVDYKMRESGNRVAILVPRDRVSPLRVSYTGNGFSGSNGVGYEIFDGQQALGTSNFQQNIKRLRALEGELVRTITSISGVRSARVHLVLPERTLFSHDQANASASIMIEAGLNLDHGTVRAITNLAASAVPELVPEQVTVLDANGNLLASARNGNTDNMSDDAMGDRMNAAQTRLQHMVSDLVGSIVGPENVRTQLTADFDFSRFTETSEIVDPDSQVVLSSTIIEEDANDQNPSRSRGVSVANGLPGDENSQNDGFAATSSNRRTEEITNYELTKTVRNAVRDEGLIVNRLSVAVAINAVDSNGDVITRSPEELQNIEALVKSAIGFDDSRGDQVQIANIAFSPSTAPTNLLPATQTPSSLLSQVNLLRFAEIAALLLIAAALVFFVLRPLFLSPVSTNERPGRDSGAIASLQNKPALAADEQSSPSQNVAGHIPQDHSQGRLEQDINIAQIEGQVKASSVNQIQQIVKGHTDESALILKRWIREAL